jgi:hypothetical protein
MPPEPLAGAQVQRMIGVEQSDQHVDIQECAHQ